MKVATVSRMDNADRSRFSELRREVDVDSLRAVEFDRLPAKIQQRLIAAALRRNKKRGHFQLAR